MKQKLYAGSNTGCKVRMERGTTTVKPAAKTQATKNQNSDARPTITLASVVSNGPNTASFSGWGPKVSGVGNVLKNWN
jgi:hypothetical protein